MPLTASASHGLIFLYSGAILAEIYSFGDQAIELE